MSHPCPRKGCTRTVSDDLLLCAPCWRPVPLPLRHALYAAWDHKRGEGTPEHRAAVLAIIRHVNGEPEPASRPAPHDLWLEAGGGTDGYSRERYLDLMREHGHILAPGDAGYEQGSRTLPCGWPGPQRPDWEPDGG